MHKKLFFYILAFIADVLFIAAVVYLHASVLLPANEYLKNALGIAQRTAQMANNEQIPNLNALLASNEQFMNNFSAISYGIVVFFLLLMIAWVITQGVGWWCAFKIEGVKKRWYFISLHALLSYILLVFGVFLSFFTPLFRLLFVVVIYLVWSLISDKLLTSSIMTKKFVFYSFGFALIRIVLLFDLLWLVGMHESGILFLFVVLAFVSYSRVKLLQVSSKKA